MSMDIKSVTVSLASGDNYVIPMQLGDTSQSAIKDLLLRHFLAENKNKSESLSIFSSKDDLIDIKPVGIEQPLISKCAYTGGMVSRGSRQMEVRNNAINFFNDNGNAFEVKKTLVEYVFGLVHGIKFNSIENYVGGMVAAGILEKHRRDNSLVRLSQAFINQQDQFGEKK